MTILLASGGLDSTTLAYKLVRDGRPFQPIFFDYGQHSVEKEWDTLLAVLPTHHSVPPPIRLNIRDVFRGSRSLLIAEPDPWTEAVDVNDMYIPYRTLLFFTVAAAQAQIRGVTDVVSGFINSNHAKELDCSAKFLNELDELAKGVGVVRFVLPFRDMSKAQVATLAWELNVPIGRTFSCQLFSDVPCGACPNCVDRIDGLAAAGLLK